MRSAVLVGRWVAFKYRRNATRRGYARTARQLRKAGVPHVVARLILFGRL